MNKLKLAEMLGFFYGISDKYPKVIRFVKEIADYLYAPVSDDANATQYTECVVKLYTETKLRFVLDECIKDEELIEKILQMLDEGEE